MSKSILTNGASLLSTKDNPSQSLLFKLLTAEHDYPYTEHDLMRFLFKLDDSIKVNIRPVIVNEEAPEYTTIGIYWKIENLF